MHGLVCAANKKVNLFSLTTNEESGNLQKFILLQNLCYNGMRRSPQVSALAPSNSSAEARVLPPLYFNASVPHKRELDHIHNFICVYNIIHIIT